MIRSVKALKEVLARGETVAVMPTDAGRMRLCVAATGEAVVRKALDAVAKQGGVSVLRTDLCGDPMQWGPS